MLATSNLGKVVELRALLGLYLNMGRVTLLTPRDWPSLLPEIDEIGATFAENAVLKAENLAAVTGLMTLADDSGLCVDALDGRPGIHSARWAGEAATDAARNALLLSEMASVPMESRAAQFVCAAALARPNKQTEIAEGRCEGFLLSEPRGSNGFGYDPLFFLPGLNRTMAELTGDEKNQISHRAGAITALAPRLQAFLRSLV